MEYRNPKSLLTVNRLDVFLKKLYFDVIGGRRSKNAELITALYRKHISIRTGGVEPPDLHSQGHHIKKQSVLDYEQSALKLLQSMETAGFKNEYAIPIANDLLLLNGAHRLAAAISLELTRVSISRSPAAGVTWCLDWFSKNFSRNEFLFLLNEYTCFRENCAPVILWGISEDQWDPIANVLASKRLLVQRAFEIDLGANFDGFYLLVHQIYGVALKANNDIRRKAIIHGCYSKRIALLHVEPEPSLDGTPSDFFQSLSNAKAYTRGFFDHAINKDLYLTLHAPDRLDEKQHMQRLLYSPASLRFHKNFDYLDDSFREALSILLKNLKHFVHQKGWDLDQICVVGSGALGAAGVRLPNDIDIVVDSALSHASESGATYSGEIDVKLEYSLNTRTLEINADNLLGQKYCFIYDGIKFADLNIVYLYKKIRGAAIDPNDLQLMRKHRKECRSLRASRLLRDELFWLESGIRRGF
ncbi:hypothetical protein MOLA814_00730 [Betaproteobacteria bacterium MOLA814]|nr:hypothetical protein MOLA814_00730 [Betaproteobacteria bacterium MOLA814]